jgi:hypothetical protein
VRPCAMSGAALARCEARPASAFGHCAGVVERDQGCEWCARQGVSGRAIRQCNLHNP